jgi:hypothetical protein
MRVRWVFTNNKKICGTLLMVSEELNYWSHLFHAMIQFFHCESGLVEATFWL